MVHKARVKIKNIFRSKPKDNMACDLSPIMSNQSHFLAIKIKQENT